MPQKKAMGFAAVMQHRHGGGGGGSSSAAPTGGRRRPSMDLREAALAIQQQNGQNSDSHSPAIRVQQALLQLSSPVSPNSPFGFFAPIPANIPPPKPAKSVSFSPRGTTTLNFNSLIPSQQHQQKQAPTIPPPAHNNQAARESYALSLINVANWHFAKGDYDRANQLFEQALFMLDKARRRGDYLKEYAQVLNGMGRIMEKQQRFDVAGAHFREADAVLRQFAQLEEAKKKGQSQQQQQQQQQQQHVMQDQSEQLQINITQNGAGLANHNANQAAAAGGSSSSTTTTQHRYFLPPPRQQQEQPPRFASSRPAANPGARPSTAPAPPPPSGGSVSASSAFPFSLSTIRSSFFPSPKNATGGSNFMLVSPRAVTTPTGDRFFIF